MPKEQTSQTVLPPSFQSNTNHLRVNDKILANTTISKRDDP